MRAACAAPDGVEPLDEAARLTLRDEGATGAVWLTDGGFAWRHEGALHLAVAPTERGAGLGGALAAAALAEPGPLTAWSHGDFAAAAALAARHGFTRTRDLWVMRLHPDSSATSHVVSGSAPSDESGGIAIRAFRPDDPADLDGVLAVNRAAFAAHPEQGALDRAGFRRRQAEPWWDPAGLLVAEDHTGIVAFHWTKIATPRLGEVYVVGVAPTAQGRGLGRLITLAGLRHLVSRGVDEIELYVESDNAAAIATYAGLGFTHAATDTHVQYAR